MKNKIQQRLKQLEKEREITILFASESGSRAWGFPSPDSDYDVRFIYARERDWYLSLRERKDTIQPPIVEDLDFVGWDLKKALVLLKKSNAAVMSWLQSPIIYHQGEGFLEEIRALSEGCFSPIGTMFHYLSMAKKYFEACEGLSEAKLKKYFYALRTALTCQWIAEKQSNPPILFADLLTLLHDQPSIKAHIEKLVLFKATKGEAYLHPKDEVVLVLVGKIIKHCDTIAKTLPGNQPDQEGLDEFFRKHLN